MPLIPSTELVQFIEEHKLPWLSLNPDTGRLEFVIDNYLLSMYRSCSAHFMLVAVEGYKRKSMSGAPERVWPLDFGALFHRLMEEYYAYYKSDNFTLESFAIDRALAHWKDMKMDYHLSNLECQAMGGYPGFAGMLVQYAMQFKAENEALNVIASEVSFGKSRDVPIYVWGQSAYEGEYASPWCPADIYLSGRVDIIGEDIKDILPMDHKTVGNFYKDPTSRFLADDGPTGYIYAVDKLLKKLFPEKHKSCNKILINIISKRIPKEGSRFKRIPIWKGAAALESYRQRVIGTCNNILNDLELYCRGLSVPRDTSKCSNWYFRDCQFLDVHRQQDAAGEAGTLKNGFIKLPLWDTESVQPLYQVETEE